MPNSAKATLLDEAKALISDIADDVDAYVHAIINLMAGLLLKTLLLPLGFLYVCY